MLGGEGGPREGNKNTSIAFKTSSVGYVDEDDDDDGGGRVWGQAVKQAAMNIKTKTPSFFSKLMGAGSSAASAPPPANTE
jgi:hypothetical protein